MTWAYAVMFGAPAVPVTIVLAKTGRLPSLWSLFDMYAGPWSSRLADDRVIATSGVFRPCAGCGLVGLAAVAGTQAGAVLNLALLPVEAVFWIGFALPVPWLFGIARIVLVSMAWPELSKSRRQATAGGFRPITASMSAAVSPNRVATRCTAPSETPTRSATTRRSGAGY